ncbi:MAG: hypothetical protein A2268_05330 [Candidatus Raymondbacteria bacterium RifOxyA12_full_50_37]|uniref:Condensin complex subunit 1 C-terminal domain-containing protein n=1 Tax=Candidatus Raymondbacteria bacterium RIFOXYD12_FULL_49_13 TaxID=1817890 RepID=A0A1F7FBX3_UNCRA|nr:MAG: hypothetical protein A2268_05330 [Candidatus Raymondbacteria bacterium RifOxyA12_full_50_37]OGJ88986.1 MAG: hypothetical protein A2248_02565 [Candidatus Raymondbacteria bacterium RIFOXYA2_FULL_49_16]OGJ92495.1 MAG: hypothetical protein A2350_15710 [Candidatus Raymondbacteria bacterium RifOxyB12_full_50_8]OGJ97014.1 MAG: hypothetical protein A2453_03985 [Candidatus Raymondbacteria bacterium RIFOXYC2_FULL_50_21]OGK02558.1 MAG: hypothetical protein A2487_15055 [Candidatus Raymondbacteria b
MDDKQFNAILLTGDEGTIVQALRTAEDEGALSLVKPMLALLKHPNKAIVRQAIMSSANLIKTQLVSSWGDIEKNVKDGLATILKRLNPAVVDRIADDLYSKDEENRLRTLQVLGLLGQDEKIKQSVSKMLTDPDERMRATAISILKNMLGHKDITIIYRVIQDPDPRVRANGVETMEAVGNTNVISSLLKMRGDKNNRVRGNVLKALYSLGYKEIAGDLCKMLEDSNKWMRATAGWVLGELGQVQEEPFLDLVGEYGIDRDPDVRQNMIKALMKINNIKSLLYCKYLFPGTEIKQAHAALERMKKFRG